jgi:hypothetical protein
MKSEGEKKAPGLFTVAERLAGKRKKKTPERERPSPETLHGSTVFLGSDAVQTRPYLAELEKRGVPGEIAAALSRAQKSSTRAKRYRGRSVDRAYDRKGDVLRRLCELLTQQDTGLRWGNDYRPESL